jgi:putative cell wall-binding protein
VSISSKLDNSLRDCLEEDAPVKKQHKSEKSQLDYIKKKEESFMSSDRISVVSSYANKDKKVEKAKDDKQEKEDVEMEAEKSIQDAATKASQEVLKESVEKSSHRPRPMQRSNL